MTWLAHPRGLNAPIAVGELELSEPSVAVPAACYATDGTEDEPSLSKSRRALVLVRMHAMPIGTILVDTGDHPIDAVACSTQAWQALEPAISAHLREDGLAPALPVPPLEPGSDPPCRLFGSAPGPDVPVSVVVATRERPRLLRACLDSLAQLDYGDYEVIVVDNDPATTETADLVRGRAHSRVRYVIEQRRGLAAAHNRGLAEAAGQVVAFTDDDVIADRNWLRGITQAMRAERGIACVTGLIMPAELVTQAQLMLEFHGHFAKGFDRRVVNIGARRPADPLFPFTVGKLGSGANMAFERATLRDVGGFDPAIGAGTLARGGDDLAAFFAVLAAGHSIAYEPSALVWHRHRRDLGSLTGQAYGYGVGLSAYLTSALARHPRMIVGALRRAPAGLAYALRPSSARNQHLDGIWPRELVRMERKGMAFGPLAYGASRWHTRGAPRPLGSERV